MNAPRLKLIGLIKVPKVALRMKTPVILWEKSWGEKKRKGKIFFFTKTRAVPPPPNNKKLKDWEQLNNAINSHLFVGLTVVSVDTVLEHVVNSVVGSVGDSVADSVVESGINSILHMLLEKVTNVYTIIGRIYCM